MTISMLLLDRDGVVNKKITNGYVTQLSEIEYIEETFEFIASLNSDNLKISVITNQQCVAKGLITIQQLNLIHDRISQEFIARNLPAPVFWVCPHLDGTCECRKPSSKLVYRALESLGSESVNAVLMIGDSESDVMAAYGAGVRVLHLHKDCSLTFCPAFAHTYEEFKLNCAKKSE